MPPPTRHSRLARLIVRGCVLCAFAGVPALAHGQTSVPVPAPHGGGAPRGPRLGGPAPESTELEVATRVALGAAPATPAAVDGGVAYVPLRDGRLVAVDLAGARVLWTAAVAATAAPAAGEGLAFVGDAGGLTAYGADGVKRWQAAVAGGVTAPLLWKAGWLVASSGGEVYCLRAADGQVVWTARVTSPVRGRPALTADHVYVSLEDGRVVAHALATGTVAWERALGGAPGPVLALDDRVFVGASDRYLYCLDARNGKRKWRYRMGGGIVGAPVLDDRQVYTASLDNVLRAFHRWNGSQRWMQGLPVRPSGAPLLVSSTLYVAGVAAELHAFRTGTGAPAGKFEAPAELAAPPQLLPDAIELLDGVVLLTRAGDLQVLRRRIEPAILPVDYPLGLPVRLEAPPTPTTPGS